MADCSIMSSAADSVQLLKKWAASRLGFSLMIFSRVLPRWICFRCRSLYQDSPTLYPEVSRRHLLVLRRSEADPFRGLGRHPPSSSLEAIYVYIYIGHVYREQLLKRKTQKWLSWNPLIPTKFLLLLPLHGVIYVLFLVLSGSPKHVLSKPSTSFTCGLSNGSRKIRAERNLRQIVAFRVR